MTPSLEREPQQGYFDRQALAAYIGKSPRTVDAWVQKGILPPPKRSGLWKIKQVDEWLDDEGDSETESRSPYSPEAIREATKALAQR